jgi:hypothetical protein
MIAKAYRIGLSVRPFNGIEVKNLASCHQHPLVRACASTPLLEKRASLPESTYSESLGLWLSANGLPVVDNPNRPKPQTKKFDVETGEDHKGA